MNKLVGCLLSCLLLVTCIQAEARAGQAAGFVAAISGRAQVVRAGRELPARMGMEIREGDKLRTFEKSRLKVLFSDDALIALGQNSEVEITKHLFGADSGQRVTRLHLKAGVIRALVQRLVAGCRVDFQVRTSNAVAGVRGTEFALAAGEKNTRLYTFNGTVAFSGSDGQRVLVAAGQGSRIEPDGRASQAEALASAELAKMRAATDTRQQPTALAMNLDRGPTDSLTAGRGGLQSTEGPATDRENLRGQAELNSDRGTGLGNWEGGGPTSEPSGSRSTFGGNAVGVIGTDGASTFTFDGSWDNPDVRPDAQDVGSVNLRIVFHRR